MNKQKWCFSCNSHYRGKFNTCCPPCYKWKRAENRLCKNCSSPDCAAPEFYPHDVNRKQKGKIKKFPLNPDWDFRGLTVEDMEKHLPSETGDNDNE